MRQVNFKRSAKGGFKRSAKGGFTAKDKEVNLEQFFTSPGNKKLWDRLEETKKRLPWIRELVDSLQGHAEILGSMTDKQKCLATSIYIDACVTTDDKLFEQVETRKLGYRLMQLRLGNKAGNLIYDIMYRADTRPFSLGQMRVIKDIANNKRVELTNIPKLTDKTFDGWFYAETEKST